MGAGDAIGDLPNDVYESKCNEKNIIINWLAHAYFIRFEN